MKVFYTLQEVGDCYKLKILNGLVISIKIKFIQDLNENNEGSVQKYIQGS